jgi:hypothetical protein
MRPTIFQVAGTLYWTLLTRNPDTGVLKDADSTPTVAVRKNGASVGDSVTVIKRSETTGIYDCSYNPAGEAEGDSFTLEESATVTGTTTSSATYVFGWSVRCVAVERGTDGVTGGLTPEEADALEEVLEKVDAFSVGLAGSSPVEPTGTTVFELLEQIASSSGTGARTVTITVNDGSAVLQNARVRLTEGAKTYTATTNVSGVVTFNVDDATYTVSITKSGYSYAGTTLVVDDDKARTYSMAQITPTAPDDPDNSLLTITCRTPSGAVESGVVISVRKKTVAVGDENNAYSGAVMTDTSDVNGIVSFEVVRAATYQWKRGTADAWTDIVIEDEENTDVTSIVGSRY